MSFMKPKFLLVLFFLLGVAWTSTAQKTNLVVFADGGEKFTLSINGVRQNATPDTNVKVRDLEGEAVRVWIDFSTPIPAIKQLVALEPGVEMTFAIRKNKKGGYALRMVSQAAITESTSAPTTLAASEPKPATPASPAPTTQTTQTQTTQTVTTPASTTTVTADGASVKINVSGMDTQSPTNANASINIEVSGVNTNTQTQSITTTTQSSTFPTPDEPRQKAEPAKAKPTSCTSAMPSANFERARKSIEAKSFAEEQMTVCNQIIKANCFSVKQVVSLMEIFTYEENKLSVAKLAYPKTVDKNNFYQINDALTYSSSVDDLNKFIEAQQ